MKALLVISMYMTSSAVGTKLPSDSIKWMADACLRRVRIAVEPARRLTSMKKAASNRNPPLLPKPAQEYSFRSCCGNKPPLLRLIPLWSCDSRLLVWRTIFSNALFKCSLTLLSASLTASSIVLISTSDVTGATSLFIIL